MDWHRLTVESQARIINLFLDKVDVMYFIKVA